MTTADWAEAAVQVAFFGPLVFGIAYTSVATWWRTAEGRAMVALDLALLLALGPSVAHYWFGLNLLHPIFADWDIASFFLVGGIALYRAEVVVRTQVRSARRERRRAREQLPEPEMEAGPDPQGEPRDTVPPPPC